MCVGLGLLFMADGAVGYPGVGWCSSLSCWLLIWLSGWECSFVAFVVVLLYFEFDYCLCFV